MNVAMIGSTGYVGSLLLEEALFRGHHVSALARDPTKLQSHAWLKVVSGSVYNEQEVARFAEGHDVVVSAFNPGYNDPAIRQHYLEGAHAILSGVRRSGVRRLFFVGGAGSLETSTGLQLVDTPEFPEEWREGALGARDALEMFRKERDIDWVFLSPAMMLQPGRRTGRYRVGQDRVLFDDDGVSRISTQDLAVAVFDEIESPRHSRERFTVAY